MFLTGRSVWKRLATARIHKQAAARGTTRTPSRRAATPAALERLEDRTLLSAGSLDTTFGTGGTVLTDLGSNPDAGVATAVQADGKIVALGLRQTGTFPGFTHHVSLARYLPNGQLDTTFGSGGLVTETRTNDINRPGDVAIQADGKILVVGRQGTGLTIGTNFSIARYNADGTPDASFGTNGIMFFGFYQLSGSDAATSVAVQADGKIVVAGNAGNSSNSDFALARLNADGTLDASFGVGGKVTLDFYGDDDVVNGVRLLADGSIVAAGYVEDAVDGRMFGVAKFDAQGSLDTSFGVAGKAKAAFGVSDIAYDVEVQADGKIIAVGESISSAYDVAVARFNADGTLDTSFGVGGMATFGAALANERAFDASIDAGGRILLAGDSSAGGPGQFQLIRLNPDGSLDDSFGDDGVVTTTVGELNSVAKSVTILQDGKILALGHDGHDLALVRYVGTAYPVLTAADESIEVGEGASATLGGTIQDFSGGTLVFDASVGDVVDNGDGTWTWSYTPADGPAGPQTVTVSVSNGQATDAVDFVLTVTNVTPVVAIGSDDSLDEGDTFARAGSFTDPGADAWTATVDYGDGTGEQSLSLNGDGTFSLSHVYADNGVYTVTVRVTDDDGATGTDTLTVTASDVAPTLVAAGPSSIGEAAPYTLALSATDPGADTITSWQINWGDGTIQQIAGNPTSVNHTYLDNGVYTISATATNEDGTFAAQSPGAVTVNNLPPVITSLNGPTESWPLLPVIYTATATDPAGGQDPRSYAWSVTRGGISVGVGVGSTYLFLPIALGLYEVKVTVTDGDGGTDVETKLLTIGRSEMRSDLIGYSQGDWQVGVSSGSSFATSVWSTETLGSTQPVLYDDFDGDGATDVLTLNASGQWRVGLSRSGNFQWSTWATWSTAVTWNNITTGDINGDGRADVLAREGNNWWGAFSTGTIFGSALPRATWTTATTSSYLVDLNNDDRDDLLTYQAGEWRAALSDGTNLVNAAIWASWNGSAAWDLLTVADVNNDGRTDIIGHTGHAWWVGVANGAGTAFTTSLFAAWSSAVTWYDPRVGDFNGDGKSDVIARTSGGDWWVGTSNGSAFSAGAGPWGVWTTSGWQDVRVGDFTGDGKDDLAVRSGGDWHVGASTGTAFGTKTLWATGWGNVTNSRLTAGNVTALSGGGSGGASSSTEDAAAASFAAAEDEALALFWSAAEEDDEFAGSLLASSV